MLGLLDVSVNTLSTALTDVSSGLTDSLTKTDISVNYIENIISVDEYIIVTVASKSNHPYSNGSTSGYYLNGIESPPLNFIVGKTYRFDQSDSTNDEHPLKFYTTADKTHGLTDSSLYDETNVSYVEGSYTQITITSETPDILYYQCSSHDYMGYLAKNNINIFDNSINSLETATTDISYNNSDTTTIFENNVKIKKELTIDESLNIIGNLDVSNTLYVDVSNNLLGINNNAPSHELDVSGDIHCSGTLFADSDLKVKKNIVPLNNALNKIVNLNGYYYHKMCETKDDKKHIGVIAQEVEDEYPELVSNATQIKSVNYDGINAILIECVKELIKENGTMKSQIHELENKIERIEKLIFKK